MCEAFVLNIQGCTNCGSDQSKNDKKEANPINRHNETKAQMEIVTNIFLNRH